MYIKTITLEGFKSYGQRTEISGFDPLFNAITGLNGSGKSNVVDAICFVLGIANLSTVRATSLQDLIFKSGQAGITKASVSITFDNRDAQQCPAGFQGKREIIVTRQISIGGKNKYFVNGISVTNKNVQDLFCSVQLNVNNPHFLIIQGRITKVLNMKPVEILSMVEEATGTSLYEAKRRDTQKLIQKKQSKLEEFQNLLKEDLGPGVQKLKDERDQFLEYQMVEVELSRLLKLFEAWQFAEAKRRVTTVNEALQQGEQQIENMKENIQNNKDAVDALAKEISASSSRDSPESAEEEQIRAQLKERGTKEAKANANLKAIKDSMKYQQDEKKKVEANIRNDENNLKKKENEYKNLEAIFETLKENDRADGEAATVAEMKYTAFCAGMEVNDQGETESLAERLIKAKEEASRAKTEHQVASMQLTACTAKLKEKTKSVTGSSADYERDNSQLATLQQSVQNIEKEINKLGYSKDRMTDLNNRRRILNEENKNLRNQLDRFEASNHRATFRYRDPEPNFNRASVKGVVCRLFRCKDARFAQGLETAAGGRLYNVVADNEAVCKKLLDHGNLQIRTTFIPLNKLKASRMPDSTVHFAQNLVGRDNCHLALSLIEYDQSLNTAMEYVFGETLICKDLNVAKEIAFHPRIRKRCVTLDGDSIDPNGSLEGGAAQQKESILKLLQAIYPVEMDLNNKEREIVEIEQEIREMKKVEERYISLSNKLDTDIREIGVMKQNLLNTSFGRGKIDIENLKTQIGELQVKLKSCQEVEKSSNEAVKALEKKMRNSSGYKNERMKQLEVEMNAAKAKAEDSKKKWEQRQQDYQTLNIEIGELKKTLEGSREELQKLEKKIKETETKFEEASGDCAVIQEQVAELQGHLDRVRALILEKNHDLQAKSTKKDELLAQNTEFQLQIQKKNHEINDLKTNLKNAKHTEHEYAKKLSKSSNNMLEEGAKLSSQAGRDLEKKIKSAQDKSKRLKRTVNAEAQGMLELLEGKVNTLLKKKNIVLQDKQKLLKIIEDLDIKKAHTLSLAVEQVSKDFGSIFSTLLPSANSKLIAVKSKDGTFQGLEIKVSLGNVWKENLTELSGGQRSLAALSLILAMLLFKPAPLYILDEVDAALDLSHTQNIGSILKKHFQTSQFIVVSLKEGMFNNANVLFKTKFIDGVSTIQRTENMRR